MFWFKKKQIPICIECEYCVVIEELSIHKCTHPMADRGFVTGFQLCTLERMYGNCGRNGK